MAGDVEMQTTPGEARLVINGDRRCREALSISAHQLGEGLQAAEHAEIGCSVQLRSVRSHAQTVALIITKRRHRAGIFCVRDKPGEAEPDAIIAIPVFEATRPIARATALCTLGDNGLDEWIWKSVRRAYGRLR